MTTNEEQDSRFNLTTAATLSAIAVQVDSLAPDLRYPAAYGLLKGYVTMLVDVHAVALSPDQLAEVREVLKGLDRLTREGAASVASQEFPEEYEGEDAGPELSQCPYCYNLVYLEQHVETCLLNPTATGET